MRVTLLSLALGCAMVIAVFSAAAQSTANTKSYPVVGEMCPDIALNQLMHGPKISSLRDFHGKWVVLDFWSKGCSACVAFFPKLNAIQKELGDRLQIILIGNNNARNKGIEPMYEKFRVRQSLELPVLYDSTVFDRFGVHGVPHVVLIEPSGVVHEVTHGDAINIESMRALLGGKPVRFFHLQSIHEANAQSELQTDEPAERNRILTGSYFAPWKNLAPKQILSRLDELRPGGYFLVEGATIEELYNYAYIGYSDWTFVDSLYSTWHRGLVVESMDRAALDPDFETGRNLFDYYLKPRKQNASIDDLKLLLQQDLAQQFGYSVSIEEREMPIWLVTMTQQAREKYKTRHTKYRKSGDITGYTFECISLHQLSTFIRSHHQENPPILVEGESSVKLDISIDTFLNDFDAVRKDLQSKGIAFKMASRKMKTLVLRPGLQ